MNYGFTLITLFLLDAVAREDQGSEYWVKDGYRGGSTNVISATSQPSIASFGIRTYANDVTLK